MIEARLPCRGKARLGDRLWIAHGTDCGVCGVAVEDAARALPGKGSRRVLDRCRGETAFLAPLRRRLRWLALSLVPSSLLMGVTTYISAEVTTMPFLWVIPLALYLLTFVLVFAPRTILPLRWMVRLQPVLIVVTAATLLCSGRRAAGSPPLRVVAPGNLLRDRDGLPRPTGGRPAGAERFTEFYLWMSLGGVVGGLFSALVAPLVFNSVLEYPLMMAAACLLRPRL